MKIFEDFLNSIKNKNIHVVGISGTEGSEIALFLNQQNINKVTLHDLSSPEKFISNFRKSHYGLSPENLEARIDQISFLPYETYYQEDYLKNIEEADLIFAPQSWKLYPSNKKLIPLKNKISTITELYLKLLPKNTIGITGSNGKSSTSYFLYQALQALNINAHLSGNDRRSEQILCKINEFQENDWTVLEISNRQLEQITQSPHISILLNISENHLDEYENGLSEYIETKAKIFKYQNKADYCLLNLDNPLVKELQPQVPSQLYPYQLQIKKQKLIVNDFSIDLNQLQIQGSHNYSNLSAIIQTLQIIGIENSKIKEAIKQIHGMPDRQEIVNTIDGINFINDRQGTSVDATLQAVENIPQPMTLIFGGENKGMPLKQLAESINKNCFLSIGIKSPFVEEIAPLLKNLITVNTTEEAFRLAFQKTPKPGNIVFSPACSYGPYFAANPSLNPNYNEFKDYMLNPPR